MTEYNHENYIKDFAHRTKANLDLYLQKKTEGDKDFNYEVTQILNSFLGLLSLPRTQAAALLNTIDISDLERKMQTKEEKNAKTLFRHLRNSIVHGHFFENMLINPESKEIESITFKEGGAHPDFEITLSIQNIKRLAEKLANAMK